MSDPITIRCRLEEGSVVVEEVIIGSYENAPPGHATNPPIVISCNGGLLELDDVLALQRRGIKIVSS